MSKLLGWQGATLATLFIGYVGYYLCRTNLSVATVLLQAPETGLSQQALGRAISLGVLLYALGKAVNGVLVDFVGGRTLFLGGMVASVACTVLLAGAGGLPLPALVIAFTLLWCLNRVVFWARQEWAPALMVVPSSGDQP
jgi:OPA family glycerol-3-phosphate transporter-like MFS transporter